MAADGNQLIGSIMIFAGNFAPRGWALCQGQLLGINAHSALFSILGTTYGGDGRTTFGLPDLRGRAPVSPGRGPGLSTYALGERGGIETNTLTVAQMPSHNHAAAGTIHASNIDGTTNDPEGNVFALAKTPKDRTTIVDTSAYGNAANVNMKANDVTVAVGNTGGSRPVLNVEPFLTVNYIIALVGIFPSRN